MAPTPAPSTYNPTIIAINNDVSNNPTKNPLIMPGISTTLHSSTARLRNNDSTEKATPLLLFAMIGVAICICGTFIIGIHKFKAHNRTEHAVNAMQAMDKPPQKQNIIKGQENALISAATAQKMEHIELEEIDHPNELRQWLENTVHLSTYYQMFIDSGYETLQQVQLIMTETHLMEIGVAETTDRVQILKEIQALRGNKHEGDERHTEPTRTIGGGVDTMVME
eukprot:471046_1